MSKELINIKSGRVIFILINKKMNKYTDLERKREKKHSPNNTPNKKTKFYDFTSVGSDLHSRLNGGIRTSMYFPSSFSIRKVLKSKETIFLYEKRKEKGCFCFSYPHICPLGDEREICDEY